MKILVVNKYHFPKGGSERYFFNIMDILRTHDHHVAPFAVDFEGTAETPYRRYFVPAPSEVGVQAHQFRLSWCRKVATSLNAFYSIEAYKRIRELLRDQESDVAYILNHSNYLSPSIIDGAKSENVPVVLRLSDYFMFCPNAMMFRKGKNFCEECMRYRYYNAMQHHCVSDSFGKSIVRALSMYFHKLIGIYHRADAYVVCTMFMRDLLLREGYQANKIYFIPTPIDSSKLVPCYDAGDVILYTGRLVPEKGILNMLEAFGRLRPDSVQLLIAGDDKSAYGQLCHRFVADNSIKNVKFLGKLNFDDLKRILRRTIFTINPSLWFENSPNNILESFAAGKAVLSSRVPGVVSQVRDGETGFLYDPTDTHSMAEIMEWMIANPEKTMEMGRFARQYVEREFSVEQHYNKLIDLFSKLAINRHSARPAWKD